MILEFIKATQCKLGMHKAIFNKIPERTRDNKIFISSLKNIAKM